MDLIQNLHEIALANLDATNRTSTTSIGCRRKVVIAWALSFQDEEFYPSKEAINGPSHENVHCTNEVGNCGCTHAEPKLITDLCKTRPSGSKFILVQRYTPCTNCANLILYSGLFVGCIYDELTKHDPRGLEHIEKVIPCLTMEDLRVASTYDPTKPNPIVTDIRERVAGYVRTWAEQISGSIRR